MDAITPIVLYLQECEDNMNLDTLLLMLPYDKSASLHRMESILNHIQALTNHPTAMLASVTKSADALFHKILPMFPFEPSIDAKLQQSLMNDLLQSVQASTSTYFTTKYQALKYDVYILQVTREATSSY